ncbi:hypothetical protein D3C80_1741040 [compost metagenome]
MLTPSNEDGRFRVAASWPDLVSNVLAFQLIDDQVADHLGAGRKKIEVRGHIAEKTRQSSGAVQEVGGLAKRSFILKISLDPVVEVERTWQRLAAINRSRCGLCPFKF